MRRYAEAVLPGHPDKFCDLVADRIVREAYKCDIEAYAQIEVSVWSDQIFLTGGIATRETAAIDTREIINRAGLETGYTPENHIDVRQYRIHDQICRLRADPATWTRFSNDQCIITGYAGYDTGTRFLPPEQFLIMYLREQLVHALKDGSLQGQGPDGKLLLVLWEENGHWKLQQLLVTLQQNEDISFFELTNILETVIKKAWEDLQKSDTRWIGKWEDILLLLNPNGPLLNGGSDGDNGQTGRKLVMDYYGPRIPIGGGAIYGKDLTHIDRLGAYAARKLALDLQQENGGEVLLRVCYAPGMDAPLSMDVQVKKKPDFDPARLHFSNMRQQICLGDLDYDNSTLGTFYNPSLSCYNRLTT